MRSFLTIALALCVPVLATRTPTNARPFVVYVTSPGTRACLATIYAPQWAVTTRACAELVASKGAVVTQDDGTALEVAAITAHGTIAALHVPAHNGTHAVLGSWNFAAAWAAGEHAEVVGEAPGAGAQTVALQRASATSPARPPGIMAVSPTMGCPMSDGGPIFADDPASQGAVTWLLIPLVAVVDAATSSCATFSAVALAPHAPFLREVSGTAVRHEVFVGHMGHGQEDRPYDGAIFMVVFAAALLLSMTAFCITPLCYLASLTKE